MVCVKVFSKLENTILIQQVLLKIFLALEQVSRCHRDGKRGIEASHKGIMALGNKWLKGTLKGHSRNLRYPTFLGPQTS